MQDFARVKMQITKHSVMCWAARLLNGLFDGWGFKAECLCCKPSIRCYTVSLAAVDTSSILNCSVN